MAGRQDTTQGETPDCADPRCRWNRPPDEGERLLRRSLGIPDDWRWPHYHEGGTVYLRLSYA